MIEGVVCDERRVQDTGRCLPRSAASGGFRDGLGPAPKGHRCLVARGWPVVLHAPIRTHGLGGASLGAPLLRQGLTFLSAALSPAETCRDRRLPSGTR